METGPCFADSALARLRAVCRQETRVAAIYAFDLGRGTDCNLAALFTESLPWPERLELELALAKALELERTELINLRRMPLVSRYSVIRSMSGTPRHWPCSSKRPSCGIRPTIRCWKLCTGRSRPSPWRRIC